MLFQSCIANQRSATDNKALRMWRCQIFSQANGISHKEMDVHLWRNTTAQHISVIMTMWSDSHRHDRVSTSEEEPSKHKTLNMSLAELENLLHPVHFFFVKLGLNTLLWSEIKCTNMSTTWQPKSQESADSLGNTPSEENENEAAGSAAGIPSYIIIMMTVVKS